MKCLISFIALIGLSLCISIGHDSKLDPGRIMWPKETWVSNPIQLSQTNDEQNVILSFTFRTSAALTNGILEVGLPSGIFGGPLLYSTSNFIPNQDTTVTGFQLTLPSAVGVYGPFSLVTRSRSTGKIYDANYIFGFISVSPSVSFSPTLIVTNSAVNPTVGSTDTLTFAFSLSKNLWKYDIIEIVPTSTYRVSSAVTCSSTAIYGVTNILYGPQGDNVLPCALATQSSSFSGPQTTTTANSANSVYIYGLAQDVYLYGNSLSVKLTVGTFTYPGFKQPSDSNTWKVNIWRWGTSTLLASYTASSGPTTPSEGFIYASWSPISQISATEVVSGMTIFTKISFTTTHDIPASGVATITFSNADPYTSNWWSDLDGSSSSNAYAI